MNWSTKHTFNPDMQAIKMRWEFQLIETNDDYILILNEEDYHTFSKAHYTALQAECEAADVVAQAIEKHGVNSVFYDGIFNDFEDQKQETKKAFGKLPDMVKMAEKFFDNARTA